MSVGGSQRLTHNVKPKWNERLLDFIELITHRRHLFCPLIGRPFHPLFTKLTSRGQGLHRVDHCALSIPRDISRALPPVIDRSAQINQMAV